MSILKEIAKALKPTHVIVRLHDGGTYLFENEEELNTFVDENLARVREVVNLVAL